MLDHLNLPTEDKLKPPIVAYLPLPESDCFRKGLARSADLPENADYCAIAEKFLDLATQFLDAVERGSSLAKVRGGRASLSELAC